MRLTSAWLSAAQSGSSPWECRFGYSCSRFHPHKEMGLVAPKIPVANAVNFGSSAKSRPRCHRQRCHGGSTHSGRLGERIQATETLPTHET